MYMHIFARQTQHSLNSTLKKDSGIEHDARVWRLIRHKTYETIWGLFEDLLCRNPRSLLVPSLAKLCIRRLVYQLDGGSVEGVPVDYSTYCTIPCNDGTSMRGDSAALVVSPGPLFLLVSRNLVASLQSCHVQSRNKVGAEQRRRC